MGLFSRKKQEEDLLPPILIENTQKKENESFDNTTSNLEKELKEVVDGENLDFKKPNSENYEKDTFENKTENLNSKNSLFDFSDEKNFNLDFEESLKKIEIPEKNLEIIKRPKEDTSYFFMTTSQCKKYLETLDNIKKNLKESSKNLKNFSNIKKHEEIEFENLKKSFSKTEEKLYEIDKMISNL